VGWKEFYRALDAGAEHHYSVIRAEHRSTWHTATTGYTMTHDPEGESYVAEYLLPGANRQGLSKHELDGHTDDSMSESESGSDDESDTESDQNEDEEPEYSGSDEYGDGSDSDEEGAAKKPAEDVEEDEEYQSDDGDAAEADDAESGDEVENALQQDKAPLRPVPELFDPCLRSPIFFGYTYHTVKDEEDEQAEFHAEEEEREKLFRERQLGNIDDALEQAKTDDENKRVGLQHKRERVLKQREKAKQKRAKERHHAAKMRAPDDAWFDNWDTTEKEVEKDEEVADAEFEAQQIAQEALMAEREREREAQADEARDAESLDRPRAPKLLAQAQKELTKNVTQLEAARGELLEAIKMLRLTRQETAGKEAQMRSVIMQAEDDVDKKERIVEQCLQKLGQAEDLLERALEVQAQEGRFLPLFDALVSEVTYQVDLGELAFAFSAGCGFAKLADKLLFNFEFFDYDNMHELSEERLQVFVGTAVHTLEKLGDIRRHWQLTDEEIASICHRAFRLFDFDKVERAHFSGEKKPGMPYFEWQSWLLHVISKSKALSELFDSPWEFEQISRYQRQNMNCCHQYELGLIHMIDLKYHVSRELVIYRRQLAPDAKEEAHELALGQGADDPLKPDYSKFLKKKKRRGWSNVIPLDHGHLHNLKDWRRKECYTSAQRLQSVWRGKKGREKADMVAKKNAFYHAKLLMLLETREKIEQIWHKKDAQSGVAKMKFDAKIRMKQTSLRASGFDYDRDETFRFMMNEQVKAAQDQEVETKFAEMEEARGYVGYNNPGGRENISGLIQKEIAHARGEKFDPKAKKAEEKVKKLAEEEKAKHLALEASTAAAEGSAAVTAAAPSAGKGKGGAAESADDNESMSSGSSSSSSSQSAALTASEDAGAVVAAAPSDPKVYDPKNIVIAIERKAAMPLGHDPVLSQQRQDKMRWGLFPGELYRTGENEEEAKLREMLAYPAPYYDPLYQRLQNLSDNMTDLKTEEMLLELPSKRLIVAYVRRFENLADLIEDLYEHFRVIRDTELVARTLLAFANSDYECGYLSDKIEELKASQELHLYNLAAGEANKHIKVSEELAVKKARAIALRSADMTEDEIAFELEQKRYEERRKREKQIADSTKNVEKHLENLIKSQKCLQECLRKQTKRDVKIQVSSTQSQNWMKRYLTALELPEEDEKQVSIKTTEIENVYVDFLACAELNAIKIISEFFLPPNEQSIKPIKYDDTDMRVGRRPKYKFQNIYFKLANDAHGIFNGSDENASKFAGNEIRASTAYTRTNVHGLCVPLQVVVDYYGFRMFCCAICPTENTVFNAQGDIKKVTEDMVFGTIDRGKKIKSTNRTLEQKLMSASKKLNLARHGVKGDDDMTQKFVPCAGDIKGFKCSDGRLYIMNLRRGMPMEDPEATPHLPQSERGQSIFYRVLRPELVQDYKVPLSADANCCISKEATDWEEHCQNAKEAAQFMCKELIPQFAEELSQRPRVAEGNLPSVANLDITEEMHRRGINMRHLGLLRTKFWTRLSATVELHFNKASIYSNGADLTEEVARGWQMRVAGQLCRVSHEGVYQPSEITLTEPYKGGSVRDVYVYAGEVSDDTNSEEIRWKLLTEMVSRTIKGIIRYYLREVLKRTHCAFRQMYEFLIVEVLNLITGSHSSSEEFWSNQVFLGIRARFGIRAIAASERPNLRRNLESHMPGIITRLQKMIGFGIKPECWEAFTQRKQNWEKSRYFKFTTSDLLEHSKLVRVKHNLCYLHFYKACNHMSQAKLCQATTYSARVLMEKPVGYWRLTERIGSRVSKNLGSGDVLMSGSYSNVIFEAPGPVKNDDMNRSARFGREQKHPSVDIRYHPHLAPQDPKQHLTVEAWARCTGMAGTLRIVVASGRFMLAALKKNCWGLVLYGQGSDITVEGPLIVEGDWVHLMGTYDGTVLRFYVDGVLVKAFEVGPALLAKLEADRLASLARWQALNDAEDEAKNDCRAITEVEAEAFFRTSVGSHEMKEQARQLQEQADFRLKVNKKAKELGLKRLSKKEAMALAKRAQTDKMFDNNMKITAAQFLLKRSALKEAEEKEQEERELLATRDLKIGGSCPSRRNKWGTSHFVGDIAHVAMYLHCLSRDVANMHHFVGIQERALQSDRDYALAAEHFETTMRYTPENADVLHKFADNICGALRYDNDHHTDTKMYKRKVAEGVAIFKRLGNPKGICEIIRCMPAEEMYGDLCCQAFETVLDMHPGFFTSHSHMPLEELGRLWNKFHLIGPGAEKEKVRVAATMAKMVLFDFPSFYGDGLQNLRWLCRLKTAELITSFMTVVETDADIRHLDLSACVDMEDDELIVVADNCRDMMSLLVPKCTKLSDFAIVGETSLAYRCHHLEKLDFSYCDLLTDKAMGALAQYCTGLRSINFSACIRISDDGFGMPLESCKYMREITLNHCEMVTDETLINIARYSGYLELLHLSYCMQITNMGLICLSKATCSATLTSLDLSACRRISDHGICSLTAKATRLTSLNLYYCTKITDRGIKAVTHNCWDLEYLNLQDMFQVTDRPFFYDHEGDGRPDVDKFMLHKIKTLNLSDCAELTDYGIAEISRRCTLLEHLTLTSCTKITDHGAIALTVDVSTGAPRVRTRSSRTHPSRSPP
jgi:hypothetical protein